MSIVIAILVVLLVAGFVFKFHPQQQKPFLAPGEILTPEPEVITEPEVVNPPIVTIEPSQEAAKMDAKPKKKQAKKVDA